MGGLKRVAAAGNWTGADGKRRRTDEKEGEGERKRRSKKGRRDGERKKLVVRVVEHLGKVS